MVGVTVLPELRGSQSEPLPTLLFLRSSHSDDWLPQLFGSVQYRRDEDRLLSASPAVFVATPAHKNEENVSPAERERVRKLIHRLHVSGGDVLKTSLRLLLPRRGCPVWMQRVVDQLQCDSCLESSDAQNAQRFSLATPPKLWQAVKVDIFE